MTKYLFNPEEIAASHTSFIISQSNWAGGLRTYHVWHNENLLQHTQATVAIFRIKMHQMAVTQSGNLILL